MGLYFISLCVIYVPIYELRNITKSITDKFNFVSMSFMLCMKHVISQSNVFFENTKDMENDKFRRT